ncbi:clathrin binding, partial [Trichomonas vaginalis G3]|uniref:clathrin binding n=1 Tax=Trichomonas vaginalis (strain ATCC PRA-98 / G3) TaxID=412133 RepID=UPI0021E61152
MQVWRFAKEKTRQAGYFFTGKSEAEKLVYEATNDDPWGPANTQMQEIARISYNYNECENVKKALWDQMGDIKEIRHVQKSLLLLEYLLRNGPEAFRSDTRTMLGQLQQLTTLHMYEVGEEAALEAVVRKKAQDIINLVNDSDLYQMEREKAKKLAGATGAVSGNTGFGFGGGYQDSYSMNSNYNDSYSNTRNYDDDYTTPSAKSKPPPSDSEDEDDLDFDPRAGAAPAPTAPAQQNTFDPFGGAQQRQQNTFDPFGNSQPQPQQNQFNAFGAPAPAQNQNQFNAFGSPAPQQNQFNAFGSPAPQQNQFNAFGSPAPAPKQQAPMDLLDFSNPPPASKPAGGFAQPMAQQQPKPQQKAPAKPINDFGGL